MSSPSPTDRQAGNGAPALNDMLHEQILVAHRAVMSGMESVNAWSDTLRTRADMTPAAILKHTEIIARLGHNAARMMMTVQKAAATIDRMERAAGRPEADRRES